MSLKNLMIDALQLAITRSYLFGDFTSKLGAETCNQMPNGGVWA